MKIFKICLIFLLVSFLINGIFSVNAEYSGGGGSFGEPHKEEEYQEDSSSGEASSGMIMQLFQLLIFGGTPITAYIIYERKLSQSARASKKIMKMLDQKDSAWKYENIMPRFKQIFEAVSNAQIQSDFDLASSHTTDTMFEKLKMQQTWAQQLQKSRTPSRIKLLDARPVAVFDCHDDECDHIWFYVEWSAFEHSGPYGITKSMNEYKGFWQLKRCQSVWKLADIVDKDKGDKLIFGEENKLQINKNE